MNKNRRQPYLMRNILAFFVISSVTLLLWDIFAVFLVAEKRENELEARGKHKSLTRNPTFSQRKTALLFTKSFGPKPSLDGNFLRNNKTAPG